MWSAVLEENGIAVIPVDHDHIRLDAAGDSAVFYVLTIPRTVRPRDIRPAPERNALLVAHAITDDALERADHHGWSVVTDDGAGWLRLSKQTFRFEATASVPAPKRARGRPGRSAFSAMRALFALEGGATQDEIASFGRVSQVAVSKALGRLSELGLVARGPAGWTVTNRAGAMSWWLANYPGPGGIETHWYGLDTIADQAWRAYCILDAGRARPAVSGDVAADLVAPWRTPRRAVLYAERGADLSEIGLTPSHPDDATLTLVLPQDHAVWPVPGLVLIEMRGRGDIGRANAFQVLYDLSRSQGPDVGEAMTAWRDWMMQGPVT